MSDDVQPATDALWEALRRLKAHFRINSDYGDMEALLLVDREVNRMAARIRADAARLAAQGWRPIETAPKDGTFVMLFDGFESETRAPRYRVARYMTARKFARRYGKGEYHEGWWDDDDTGGPIEGATHWRPLLAPPGDV